jgi:hypothetical protein
MPVRLRRSMALQPLRSQTRNEQALSQAGR